MIQEENKEDLAARQASAAKISGYANPKALISVYDLNESINESDILIVDTRGRTHRIYQRSYLLGHLPGAVPILYSNYSHPVHQGRMTTPDQFQNVLGNIGAGNSSTIVLYGDDGLQARLYWAIKMYGYENVKILDGGLNKWKEARYDITSIESARPPQNFEFDLAKSKAESMLATLHEVEAAAGNLNCIIIDTRSKDEFIKGHINGSINVPWTSLFNKDMTFKSAPELKVLFESKKITSDKKVITYCNDGIYSSLVWFVLSELLGYQNIKNYDGSLNEWLIKGHLVEKDVQTDSQKTFNNSMER
ncbi:MAG: Thiosulfate sulfurtransferase [Pelotomaculum sp. PtaB.Bin104]|nr:MAG: Thiosulfate sulfurtransferase [Pelotomaculum sp. PtaB.Bin104]